MSVSESLLSAAAALARQRTSLHFSHVSYTALSTSLVSLAIRSRCVSPTLSISFLVAPYVTSRLVAHSSCRFASSLTVCMMFSSTVRLTIRISTTSLALKRLLIAALIF